MGYDMRFVKSTGCPTPEYHQTHRYCPSCPWTEALNRPQCLALLEHATNPSLTWKCEDYQGHHGDHSRVLPGYKTPTKLTWQAGGQPIQQKGTD